MCFVRESQKYPDDAKPVHALRSASLFFPNWDRNLADRLVDDFELPLNRRIKKLSRGQLSAVGVIIGIASRAEITFFDEPYLGLDAVARQIFYDRLLADYAEHPRTVILSSHLIDEVSNLIERVLVIDRGRIIIDEQTDAIRDRAANIVGDTAAVDAFVADREVIHRESLGRVSSVTVLGVLSPADRARLADAGLDVAPVSLQQLIVRTTQHVDGEPSQAAPPRTSGTRTSAPEHPAPTRRGRSDEPHAQRRPHAADQPPDLRLGSPADPRRLVRPDSHHLLAHPGRGEKWGGAAQSTYWYFLALGVLAMSATFPFSQAMSVTRREFYLGTLATAALASGILAAIFVLAALVEQATGGWGLNGGTSTSLPCGRTDGRGPGSAGS